MGMTPDLAGFDQAQRSLLANFGRDVRFYAPVNEAWDPTMPGNMFDASGVPLDPLAPLDPTVVSPEDTTLPIAGLWLVGQAHCNVVYKPLQTSLLRRDQSMETPLAIRSGLNRDLIVNIEDHDQLAQGNQEATYFWIGSTDANGVWQPMDEEMVKITGVKTDTFGGVERLIVYGQDTE